MFTGLIADLGSVTSFVPNGQGATLEIRTSLAGRLARGDSVAVNGVCLTATAVHDGRTAVHDGRTDGHDGATDVHDGRFEAAAMVETLRRSSLGGLQPGAKVNLELPLRAGDPLGGHIVQGHVDGTGTVRETRSEGVARVLRIDCDPSLLPCLVEKGSITVDGVSLTVSGLHEDGFEVSLIPETMRATTLGEANPGDRVNLEVDVLAKHVKRLMEASRA